MNHSGRNKAPNSRDEPVLCPHITDFLMEDESSPGAKCFAAGRTTTVGYFRFLVAAAPV